jgi:two-component system, OmpR family, KDP operon response regulator KdpE
MTRVLIVEDDAQLRRAIAINLRAQGYEIESASDGSTALRIAAATVPDLVTLDLGLPDIDGADIIRGLRAWTDIPIIVLSARDTQADIVDALDAGADDYLTKPFGMNELLARMRAASRRAPTNTGPPIISTDQFTIDLTAKRVITPHGEVRLTPTEWRLLEVLVRSPGKLLTQRQLLQQVWGSAYETEGSYLRVYVGQLRQKLEDDRANPRHLITEPGIGYRFEP